MRRLLLALAATVVFSGAAGAQTGDSVDAFVRAFIRQKNIPSAAISVVHHGKVLKAAGYGIANLELGVAATEHSVFEIGSMTKQITAEALMMLVEEGKLSLDDSVSKHLPGLPESWSGIRLRHLLTHTSGLPDWESDSTFSYRREYSLAEFVEFVSRHPLDFPPGTRFGYSNSAYPLLGKVIEKVAGMPYKQFITERIFAPAGMTETRFRDNASIVPNRASGYVDRNGTFINGERLRAEILAPNGGVLSTATDMARWNVALSNGLLVKPSSMAQMTTPTQFNDGSVFPVGAIGWFLGAFRGHKMLLHNGSTVAGFSSVIYRYPDDDLSVVVMFNVDRFDTVNKLAVDVAGFYVPGLSMRSLAARRDPNPELSRKLLAMLGDVADGHDSEMLAPNLRNPGGAPRTPPARGFKAPSARITFLEAEDLGAAAADPAGPKARWIYRYKLEGGGRVVFYTLELSPEQKVTRIAAEEGY
jgi:CubicO group peptidase (beta-lactamase class C family)